MSASDGLRLALATFTTVRVDPPVRLDRRTARAALAWAPLAGVAIGGCAAVVLETVRQATHHSVAGVYLAAVLALSTVWVLTRGIHLDALADTADGLRSRRGAAAALEVMRRPDVGTAGVVSVVWALVVQTAAVAESIGRGTGWLGVLVAVTAGRTCIMWGCRPGVRAARPNGVGAAFAGALAPGTAAVMTALVACAAAGVSWLDDDRSWWLAVRAAVAVVAAAAVAATLVHRSGRRLGGVTGEVLGASVELGTAAALLCFALV